MVMQSQKRIRVSGEVKNPFHYVNICPQCRRLAGFEVVWTKLLIRTLLLLPAAGREDVTETLRFSARSHGVSEADLPGSAGALQGSGLRDLHAKKPLVEGSGEEGVQQVLMDQRQAQDAPTEAEPTRHTKNIQQSILLYSSCSVRPASLDLVCLEPLTSDTLSLVEAMTRHSSI